MTFWMIKNINIHNKKKKSTMIWKMCHDKGGSIHAIILTKKIWFLKLQCFLKKKKIVNKFTKDKTIC
jgi:hypothetical protein